MDVVKLLEFFLERMLGWEVEYNKRRRSVGYKTSAEERFKADIETRAKLAGVFEEFLSCKANETIARSRLDMLNTARPPEFAQAVIVDSQKESGGSFFVETFNAKALVPCRRYCVVVEDGVLKINALYGRVSEAEKWSSRESI
ncbi:hypothetical protein [Pseudomonas sichuanensis]|uniref:hypothetical protein n=1 Tax=Pseudomonas sichuanensis TaxID=2213015 RepID=UPI000DA65B3B|nr:hypothetical protein [Pseudomonas sichuanensis]